jgi:hypothetical protein
VRAPVLFASADEPALRGLEWISQQWEASRLALNRRGGVLVLDEVQKAAGWAESVTRLWDEETRGKRPLRVVLPGSAPLLVRRGLARAWQAASRSCTSSTGPGRGQTPPRSPITSNCSVLLLHTGTTIEWLAADVLAVPSWRVL